MKTLSPVEKIDLFSIKSQKYFDHSKFEEIEENYQVKSSWSQLHFSIEKLFTNTIIPLLTTRV